MQTYLKDLRWGRFNLIEGDFISEIASCYGEWSEAEVMIFKLLLSDTSNVIEVGSNIGMHAVPLAKFASQGKVLCFEPQRIIFQQLCCNLALNNLINVESYRLGVSDQNTKAWIETSDYSQPWNYGSFSIDKGFSTESHFQGKILKEEIGIVKLDDFASVQRLASLDLLKIDAEGFDLRVLNGAKETIKRAQPAIFIESHYASANGILDYLRQINYQAYWVISDRYQENNFYQSPRRENGFDINLLAIPSSWNYTATEQNRTEQNRTEQNRTEQNRTEQNRTEQNRTEQNRTEQFYSNSFLI
ncbi:FkbM family methyltransferase [Actinobacillus porcinus]|uniref:FkbM family methyltransferase n=1 Tax=Actinobacillus porcinus TaxID=51048 RepID=UPI002A90C720|nr:FkbM family methyltransferase [Actinobacillus porcinus]MDY5847200.1 FkbM family methyltransferase [Actinobacillus porcinus]